MDRDYVYDLLNLMFVQGLYALYVLQHIQYSTYGCILHLLYLNHHTYGLVGNSNALVIAGLLFVLMCQRYYYEHTVLTARTLLYCSC